MYPRPTSHSSSSSIARIDTTRLTLWLDLRTESHAVHSPRACALKTPRRVQWRLNRERIENPSQRIVDRERIAIQKMMLESLSARSVLPGSAKSPGKQHKPSADFWAIRRLGSCDLKPPGRIGRTLRRRCSFAHGRELLCDRGGCLDRGHAPPLTHERPTDNKCPSSGSLTRTPGQVSDRRRVRAFRAGQDSRWYRSHVRDSARYHGKQGTAGGRSQLASVGR